MKYEVHKTKEGVTIQAAAVGEQQMALLEEFGKCANGTCSCQSTEYEKLSSINVKQSESGVTVELTAKDGEVIDTDAVNHCLTSTVNKLSK